MSGYDIGHVTRPASAKGRKTSVPDKTSRSRERSRDHVGAARDHPGYAAGLEEEGGAMMQRLAVVMKAKVGGIAPLKS
eukprot:3940429-Rhodomonas_salina.2